MNVKTPLIISLGLTALMFAASAVTFVILFPSLEAALAAEMTGRMMQLAFVPVVLFMMPSIALFLTIVMALIPRLLVPQTGVGQERWYAYETIWILVILIIGFSHAVIIATSLGMKFAQ